MQSTCILCAHILVFYSLGLAEDDLRHLTTKFRPGIIGGTPTTIQNAPYLAAILREDGKFKRLGAVIGKKFILTSAFMADDGIDIINKVRVGSADFTQGGQLIDIVNITKHDKYDDIYSHEVGIIRLVSDMEYSDTVKPIKLATISGEPGSSATLTGFAPTLDNTSYHLTEGIQTIIVRRKCQRYFYTDEEIYLDESNLCAYNASVCACRKDVGAPFVQEKVLIAFFIGGTFCCEDKRPQVYVDVPRIHGWVRSTLKEQGHDEEVNIGHYFGEDTMATNFY